MAAYNFSGFLDSTNKTQLSGFFDGCVFATCGHLKRSSFTWFDDIEVQGGKGVWSIDETVTHIVCSSTSDIRANRQLVQDAKHESCWLVSEKFLEQCFEHNSRLSEYDFLMALAPKNPLMPVRAMPIGACKPLHSRDVSPVLSLKRTSTRKTKTSSVPQTSKMPLTMDNSVISLTFGECVENHTGMQMIGKTGEKGTGFTTDDLKSIEARINDLAIASPDIGKSVAKVFNLSEYISQEDIVMHSSVPPSNCTASSSTSITIPEASLLVIKGGVDLLLGKGKAGELFNEQTTLTPDTKMRSRGRVVNKHARHNLCFADVNQQADFPNGKGTIINFNGEKIPVLNQLRGVLGRLIHPKAENLYAEGNYYYDKKKCYIGLHGDSERVKVVCARLGADFSIFFQWYLGASGGTAIGKKISFTLSHGDMYIMSEKAVGNDWDNMTVPYRRMLTLRHGANFKDIGMDVHASSLGKGVYCDISSLEPSFLELTVKKTKTKKRSQNNLVCDDPLYVINPLTMKKIKRGGGVYKKLLKEGVKFE